MKNTLEKHWGYSSFRENQEAAIADILEGKKDVLFLARTGAGKALHPSTPILTPNGYVPMEDLKEGDYVYGLDGKPTKVLSKHAPLTTEHYEIEFSNGQSIKCCSEHLWKLASGSVIDTSSLNVGDILPAISAPSYELSHGGFERGGWYARSVSSDVILSEDFLAGILFECGGGNVAMHHDKRVIDTIVELLSLLGIQATYYADLLHVVVWEGKSYPSKHYYTYDKPAKPLSVVNKRKIPSREQYYCITVDNEDSVFLASRANIPTHNSIVFQLPILMMEGMAIVISPLLALMQDQVLTAKEKGIKAYAYNSTLSKRDKRELLDKIKAGGVDLLYISPESLGSIIGYLKEYGKVQYIALDEAHCFPGDTRVITEDGAKSFYELESMPILPKVLSKNLNTGKTEYKQIKNVFRNPFQPLLKISLNERSNFLVSYNHVIFTKRGEGYPKGASLREVLAKDLTVDDKLISLEEVDIQGIQKVSTTYEHLYDIEVEDNHNYFIDCGLPILVHNCTSQYGHDFRPDYSLIGKELTAHFPTTPIVALTATADLETRQDIIDILRLGMNRDLSTYVQNLDRPNIHYHVEPRVGNGHKQLLKILKNTEGRAIVYCLTKAECDAVSRFLYTHGYKARPYYSTISKRDKEVYLKGFMNGDVQVICATSAFGLGIDVEVKTVVCLGMPGTIEDIAQFWGRGSRAGLEAHAYLFYNSTKDAGLHKYFLQNVSNPARRKVVEKKLRETLEFVQSDECLRKQILGYFGQEAPDDCGKCDNCC